VDFAADGDEKLIFNTETLEEAKILMKKTLVKFSKIYKDKLNLNLNKIICIYSKLISCKDFTVE